MSLSEKNRLFQAVLEDRRARRNEIGDGYQTDGEREELDRLDAEVNEARREMSLAWEALQP